MRARLEREVEYLNQSIADVVDHVKQTEEEFAGFKGDVRNILQQMRDSLDARGKGVKNVEDRNQTMAAELRRQQVDLRDFGAQQREQDTKLQEVSIAVRQLAQTVSDLARVALPR